MPIYFTRLTVGYPGPLKKLEDFPDSWRVYTICKTPHIGSSTMIEDVRKLEKSEQTHARSAFITLLGKAQAGKPLKDQYDEKKCHEAHSFEFDGSPVKIYRIRSEDVRIYFCYLPPNKKIILLKIKPKRKNELSEHEKKQLEIIASDVLQYSDPTYFESRIVT